MTIYEKEALFDQLDEDFAQIKRSIYDTVGHEELHEVEGAVFRKLQILGRQLLSNFVRLSGTGYEAGHPVESESGLKMRYKGTQACTYLSIFGEIQIPRAAYAHPDGGYIYPLDTQLNLPGHKYSYLPVRVRTQTGLLLKWGIIYNGKHPVCNRWVGEQEGRGWDLNP